MSETFKNPWPHDAHGVCDILRWKLGLMAREQSTYPAAKESGIEVRNLDEEFLGESPKDRWRIAWLGHASFLIQGFGLNFLIDPVFSDYCSPVPIPSLKRLVPPPCRVSDLPKIDAVLLTHSHYDHLDLGTLRALGEEVPLVIAQGHGKWLERKGFESVSELAWGESLEIGGFQISAVPAQHFTARTPFDRNQGHWCGWVIEGGGRTLWHAGDSGYCPAFAEIGKRFGKIDFGMIPIGAYQPRAIMRSMHMNPAEAVRAFQEANCARAVAMHWGTFRLTDEPVGEPPLLLRDALEHAEIPASCFTTGDVGEVWEV